MGIVGLGYAGLPLAMSFAEAGFDVTGIDLNEERVQAVRDKQSYLVDVPEARYDGLEGALSASSDYSAVQELDALTICVPTPLSKTREELHHALDRPWATVRFSSHRQILVHGERGENATTLRHQPEAQADYAVRGPSGNIALFKEHLASPRRGEANDGANQRGFTHAVSPQDAYDLTALHAERDSLEDVAIAVVGVDVVYLQHVARR